MFGWSTGVLFSVVNHLQGMFRDHRKTQRSEYPVITPPTNPSDYALCKTPRLFLILPVAIMAAVSCTSVTTETDTQTKINQGVPGGEFVETTRLEATVTAIDSAKRKVSLVTRKGEKFTVNPGPEVENFAQIRVGDQLKVAFTEEITVRMAKPGEKPADGGEAEFDFAPGAPSRV